MSFLTREEFTNLVKEDINRLYDYLTEKFSALESKIDEQSKIIVKQETRIKELESKLNQNSSNSSKPPSSDQFKKNLADNKRTSRRKSGGQPGHKGSNLKMVSNPDTIKKYSAPEVCLNCGESLVDLKSKINRIQEFDIPEIKFHVTEHQIEKKKCSCGHCNIAPNVPQMKNHVFYGDRIRGLILYLKNVQMLPFQRTKQIVKDILNHDISEGTFWNVEKEFSEKAKPTEDKIKQEIIGSIQAGADETSSRVNGKNYWIHVVVTKLFSHFCSSSKRGKVGMKVAGILEKFKGVLSHDFFAPYLSMVSKHAFCNAHILRELIGIYENTPQVWADQMIQLLILSLDTKKENLPNAPNENIINEILILYDKAIQKGYEENPLVVDNKKVKNSKPLNLLKRLDSHRGDVMRFLSSTEIPFDNNASERALRMIKVKNKISGCFRNSAGSEYFSRTRSIVDTCRKQNLNILNSITKILKGETLQFRSE